MDPPHALSMRGRGPTPTSIKAPRLFTILTIPSTTTKASSMDSKVSFIVFHSLCLFMVSFCQQTQQQQQQTVVQPTSDVNPDRSFFNQPASYDYTYLTKPYGYSAYRAHDQGLLPQQTGFSNTGSGNYGGGSYGGYGGGSYGGGYGTSTSNYGNPMSMFQSAWPLILLPFLVFFGLTFFFPLVVHLPNQWGSRQSPNEPTDEASFIIQSVIQAVESNKCLQKTACDLGLYTKQLGDTKDTVLQYVEKFSPPTLNAYIEVLKEAANYKGNVKDYCKKFNCDKVLLGDKDENE